MAKKNDAPKNNKDVNMNLIWKWRAECIRNTGKYPDNVMIHPVNKANLEAEAMLTENFKMPHPKKARCFGMKVIWTYEIEEHEVICTFNGR